MKINKKNIKKLIASGMVLVTTMLPISANAMVYFKQNGETKIIDDSQFLRVRFYTEGDVLYGFSICGKFIRLEDGYPAPKPSMYNYKDEYDSIDDLNFSSDVGPINVIFNEIGSTFYFKEFGSDNYIAIDTDVKGPYKGQFILDKNFKFEQDFEYQKNFDKQFDHLYNLFMDVKSYINNGSMVNDESYYLTRNENGDIAKWHHPLVLESLVPYNSKDKEIMHEVNNRLNEIETRMIYKESPLVLKAKLLELFNMDKIDYLQVKYDSTFYRLPVTHYTMAQLEKFYLTFFKDEKDFEAVNYKEHTIDEHLTKVLNLFGNVLDVNPFYVNGSYSYEDCSSELNKINNKEMLYCDAISDFLVKDKFPTNLSYSTYDDNLKQYSYDAYAMKFCCLLRNNVIDIMNITAHPDEVKKELAKYLNFMIDFIYYNKPLTLKYISGSDIDVYFNDLNDETKFYFMTLASNDLGIYFTEFSKNGLNLDFYHNEIKKDYQIYYDKMIELMMYSPSDFIKRR